ncbi:hypothetical protein ES703_93947 [subsurface metagenome]
MGGITILFLTFSLPIAPGLNNLSNFCAIFTLPLYIPFDILGIVSQAYLICSDWSIAPSLDPVNILCPSTIFTTETQSANPR